MADGGRTKRGLTKAAEVAAIVAAVAAAVARCLQILDRPAHPPGSVAVPTASALAVRSQVAPDAEEPRPSDHRPPILILWAGVATAIAAIAAVAVLAAVVSSDWWGHLARPWLFGLVLGVSAVGPVVAYTWALWGSLVALGWWSVAIVGAAAAIGPAAGAGGVIGWLSLVPAWKPTAATQPTTVAPVAPAERGDLAKAVVIVAFLGMMYEAMKARVAIDKATNGG